jgi:hypothetical protein
MALHHNQLLPCPGVKYSCGLVVRTNNDAPPVWAEPCRIDPVFRLQHGDQSAVRSARRPDTGVAAAQEIMGKG